MTTPTNDDDEWMVVSRGTQRKVAKRRYGTPSRAVGDTKTKADEEPETAPADVRSQLSSCTDKLHKSQFYANMTHSWESFLQAAQPEDEDEEGCAVAASVNEIVCYGIGNFAQRSSHFSGPLWQLALALELQKLVVSNHHPSTKTTAMVYYDPLVTPVERQLLQDYYQIEVLATNEKGKRICRPSSDYKRSSSSDNSQLLSISATTLFFMPHCPKGLYENVLWANWDELMSNPHSLCIVGNSLATYVERATAKTRNNSPSCLELVQPFLREQNIAYSKKDVRDMPGYFEAAFNDTYLTWFDHRSSAVSSAGHDESTLKPMHEWPKRPEQPSQDGQNEVL